MMDSGNNGNDRPVPGESIFSKVAAGQRSDDAYAGTYGKARGTDFTKPVGPAELPTAHVPTHAEPACFTIKHRGIKE